MPTSIDLAMAEKCIRNLPPVRVSDTLERTLMRLAAADDRSLSEFIRLVLTRYALGYAASLPPDDEGHQ
jgi:hypothetical protein